MKVRELIAQLSEYDEDLEAVIEVYDDGLLVVDDVDVAIIKDLKARRLRWDFQSNKVNAVRICG